MCKFLPYFTLYKIKSLTLGRFNFNSRLTMKRYILLTLALFIGVMAHSQQPFNGRIRSFDNKGVKARIVVRNRDKQTISDGKGRFGLTDVKADDVLLVIVKRDTMEIPVAGRQSIDIVIASEGDSYNAEESSELMNYGYGYVKRRESTDFSSGISGDRLRAMGTSNLGDAIVKCYPGLRYVNGELCLRTQNSINSSSAVLVLCDGIEANLDFINIHDVKSVEVIKSSNMYGFRGVHGVVLITTMTAQDQLDALDRMSERGKRY